jgi:hypothetical protein
MPDAWASISISSTSNSTIAGSNCVPAQRRSSLIASDVWRGRW